MHRGSMTHVAFSLVVAIMRTTPITPFTSFAKLSSGGNGSASRGVLSKKTWSHMSIIMMHSRSQERGAYMTKISSSILPRTLSIMRVSSQTVNSALSDNGENVGKINKKGLEERRQLKLQRKEELKEQRRQLLHEQLSLLGIDPESIAIAERKAMIDPTIGFDPKYGRSAIKAYRSHVRPKPKLNRKSKNKMKKLHNNEKKKGKRRRGGEGMERGEVNDENEGIEIRDEANDDRENDDVEDEDEDYDDDDEDPAVAASRVARQIEHLARHHRSRNAQWVRHTDTDISLSSSKDGDNNNDEGSEQVKSRKAFPLYIILDNLRSAFNVGSIFRSADACGVSAILTCGVSAHPGGGGAEKLERAALGAESIVPTKHFRTASEAVSWIRNVGVGSRFGGGGVYIAGLETTKRSVSYLDISYPGSDCDGGGGDGEIDVDDSRHGSFGGTCLVLGNEVGGIDVDVLETLDAVLEVPMFGAKNSLNVAACAPVVMYEVLRQWGVTKRSPISQPK